MENVCLFGGGVSVDLPRNRVDASAVRSVPDNQEVFMHPSCGNSIIVDLCERVDAVNDEEALRIHFDDICGAQSHHIVSSRRLAQNEYKLANCAASFHLDGAVSDAGGRPFLSMDLLLFRLLPEYSTDLLITYNKPVNENAVGWPEDLWMKLASSVQINNFDMLKG